jgi:hypothetical protein
VFVYEYINRNFKLFETMSNSGNSGGVSFLGILTALFVGLKLTNYIDWSWWWILSPIWIPICLVIIGFGIFLILKK